MKMDGVYDYNLYEEDPDDLFEATKGLLTEIQGVVTTLSEAQGKNFDEFLETAMCEVIFGSNCIENAGCGHGVTIRLCKEIFQGRDPATVQPRTQEEEEAIRDLAGQNLPNTKTEIPRSRKEIIQHALAFKYIAIRMILQNEPLSEQLIKDTHKVLTEGLDSDDGDRSETYSGQYRTEEVVAGMSGMFTPTAQVAMAMRRVVAEFNQDIAAAEANRVLDPYALAAKYCHKFVNIHPFLDGNGRTCRLILNTILLKYAGIVVPIGEKDEDREDYMEIANKATMAEQVEEDERSRDPWGELASFVLRKGAEKMQTLRNTLKGRKV